MDRLTQILKYVDKTKLGIEVAPYFNPIVPKREGNNVLILDVVDTEALKASAAKDNYIPDNRIDEIEQVDLVCSACDIEDAVQQKNLVGEIDFIVSSHNFEHLPDPIRFLQGCYEVLAPGGALSMAVPDCRSCFDHYRPPSKLSDWVSAFHRSSTQPSPEQIFDSSINCAQFYNGERMQPGCSFELDDPYNFIPAQNLKDEYAGYISRLETEQTYTDAHCSTFFPTSLKLLLGDLRHLGLVKFAVREVSKTHHHEFYVHLTKPSDTYSLSDKDFYFVRKRLLQKFNEELGSAPFRKTIQN